MTNEIVGYIVLCSAAEGELDWIVCDPNLDEAETAMNEWLAEHDDEEAHAFVVPVVALGTA